MAANVVRAVDLVPSAFAGGNKLSTELEDTYEFDTGNLMALNTAVVDTAALKAHKEAHLLELAEAGIQLLIKKIWGCPIERSTDGPMVTLPAGTERCPRMLPAPKPKPPTRWELFAKEKGIQKQKRERMVWDEQYQEWRPRYGFKRANDPMHDWLVPVADKPDAAVDQYEKMALEKKKRVVGNKLNQIRNLERASAAGPAAGIAPAMSEAAAGKRKRGQRAPPPALTVAKETRGVKQARLAMASLSTPSLGKFDAFLPGEPTRPKDASKKRRMPVEGSQTEKSVQMDALRKVLGTTARLSRQKISKPSETPDDRERRIQSTKDKEKGKGKPKASKSPKKGKPAGRPGKKQRTGGDDE